MGTRRSCVRLAGVEATNTSGLLFQALSTALRGRHRTWMAMRRLLLRGTHSLTVQTRQGFRIEIDPWDRIGTDILVHGIWEEGVTRELIKRVVPGSTIIDIGANIGYFTLLLSQLTGPHGHVWAFEPIVTDQLRRNLDLNIDILPWLAPDCAPLAVCVHSSAAWECSGVTLHMTQRHGANVGSWGVRGGAALVTDAPVPTAALDDALAVGTPVDLIKMDVEGAEGMVLRGARRLLATHRPTILFEWHPELAAEMATTPTQMTALLAGYDLWEIGDDGATHPLVQLPTDPAARPHILAVHAEGRPGTGGL